MSIKLDYNLDWSSYFQLDDISPSGLIRIKNKGGKNVDGYAVGTPEFTKNGYPAGYRLSFQLKMYYVHRIIWVMTYGSIDPNLVIDHLDGNPFNNSIDNLKLKTSKGNSRNRRKQVDNTTGTSGVRVARNQVGNIYYVANWYNHDGFQESKCFSVLKLGEETAKALAIAYREEQITRLILEGAEYTARHGVDTG